MADNIPTIKLEWDKATGAYTRETVKRVKVDPFLKGPIPLAWLAQAAQLPGKTLQVGLLLWYVAGIAKRRDGLVLPGTVRDAWGIARWAYYEALARLEAAGLVSVVREGKQSAVVTILNVEE